MHTSSRTDTLRWPSVTFSTPEHPLTPDQLNALMSDARRALTATASFPLEERLVLLSRFAEQWRNARSPWRKRAEQLLMSSSRLSRPMLNACLDLFFRSMKREAMDEVARHFSSARPELVGHILPGNVLAASAESFIVDLILGHVNLVKVSSRAPVFPLLLAETLSELDPRLGNLISIVSWKGGEEDLERTLAAGVDRLVVYGTADTIDHMRRLSSGRAKLDAFGPGSAVGIIRKNSVWMRDLAHLAARVALDASLYDQRGCLSLQTVFIEEGGEVSPRVFTDALTDAMESMSVRYPAGELTVAEAAVVRRRRNLWRVKELSGEPVTNAFGAENAWSVHLEPKLFMDEPICGRIVTVRSFSSFDDLCALIDTHRGTIHGLALTSLAEINSWQARGICRTAEFGALQFAPLAWQRLGDGPGRAR